MALRPQVKVDEEEANLARFMLTRSFHFSGTHLRARKTIADSQANAQPGDVVWTGLTAASLPQGFNPLDAAGTTLKSQSRWASALADTWVCGADSVD
jgi:hypothetical protein